MATLQDFSLIKTYVSQFQKDYDLVKPSKAFIYFCLDMILNLQQDEIEESITDKGADRGIDAIYIDENSSIAKIHIFNCKYAYEYDGIKKNFPSNEIDKITNIIGQILDKDSQLEKEVNPLLYEQIKNIWRIFETQNPEFTVYLCSNFEYNLTISEEGRFKREIGKYTNFTIKYYNMNDFVNFLTSKGRKKIDGQITAIDNNYFSKIDGDIRGLIANVEAEEFLKLVTNEFKSNSIIEDIFNDNIRIFLQYRSRINKAIKETALKEDNYKFFYFNNGITITCDKFSYENRRAPIVKLTNFQIVNGGQTINALHDAYLENKERVKDINILVRIYEITGDEISQRIAEFTNSQNPVKNRDIRANDFIQKKLGKELEAYGYYYERKKNYYKDKPKNKRLDSEKIGQILLTFYNNMPGDAKNKKKSIFEDNFETIFNADLTAEKVLLAYNLYEKIEKEKIKEEEKISTLGDEKEIEEKNFILYASYYILYLLKKLALSKNIKIERASQGKIIELYPEAVKLIKEMILKEKKENIKYMHSYFFKSNKLKKNIDDHFENVKI
ncbi:MAG: AIPR family protein [Candidatus Stahlbacteria bacterium]|nr:AIPR family protein [Candidatus Stahlbacteria bacterium]